MAQFHGSDGVVKIGTNVVAEIKGFEVNEQAATFRTNAPTMNTPAPAATFKAGETTWDASLDCFWDDTDTNGQEALTIGASVTVHLLPKGATTGNTDLTGTALVTEVGIPAAHDGIVERRIKVQGTGALTHGTAA